MWVVLEWGEADEPTVGDGIVHFKEAAAFDAASKLPRDVLSDGSRTRHTVHQLDVGELVSPVETVDTIGGVL